METELRGLYAVTDPQLIPAGGLLEAVEAAIAGGARLIQYRDKSDDQARRRQQAEDLQSLCLRHGVPLLINDDVALTADVGAAGVHLGKDDPAIESARKRLGPNVLIGVSCYASIGLALAAQRAGAHYVAFGSVFASRTKPQARRASLDLLTEARSRLTIPICAIGGITADNVDRVVSAGADMVAVVSGVFGTTDIRAAAASISRAFRPVSERRD